MNDGFYTMLAAALGCRVYAFEVQQMCVDIAHSMLKRNDFDDAVTILHRPVSAKNNVAVDIPNLRACDGGFSLRWNASKGGRIGHLGLAVDGGTAMNHFNAVSLDAFFPPGPTIDVLKLDTEGHEMMVIRGALGLFRAGRIRKAYVEVMLASDPKAAWKSHVAVFKKILHYGYTAQFIGDGRRPKSSSLHCPSAVFTAETWADFVQYLRDSRRDRCIDVVLSSKLISSSS